MTEPQLALWNLRAKYKNQNVAPSRLIHPHDRVWWGLQCTWISASTYPLGLEALRRKNSSNLTWWPQSWRLQLGDIVCGTWVILETKLQRESEMERKAVGVAHNTFRSSTMSIKQEMRQRPDRSAGSSVDFPPPSK